MKISIDGILGSAKKINNQRKFEEENFNNKKKKVKSDSVAITSKVNSRLDNIESEFREIQSSLTKNQIIRNGIEQLMNNTPGNGKNQERILNEVRFEGNKVLMGFIGEPVKNDKFEPKFNDINELINNDVSNLKRLQVEVDNIMASNLAGPGKLGSIMSNIDSLFSDFQNANLENISTLKADAVKKLIK